MDLLKKLTGKNPDEYESVAKSLVDNSDTELFAKLVKQDGFLFDFVKNNVSSRIRKACNKNNYQNLLNFFEYYSPSYDSMFADVLYAFGGKELLPIIKELFVNGDNNKKAYAVKFFLNLERENLEDILPIIRKTAISDFEPLSINSIELLSKFNDVSFEDYALSKLNSEDEFEQYDGVKYLVSFKSVKYIDKIISVMKKSSLSENIAAEIPYLIPVEDLVNSDDGILVICNIVNAIPEIIPASSVLDYNLFNLFENLYINKLNSASAVLLKLAQEKFKELTSNEEYLFDCDKNTKDEVLAINSLLKGIDEYKLKNLLYDELYDSSDFVMFAVDFVDELEELETMLDSENQTLVLKILSKLKQKGVLNNSHKDTALNVIKDVNLISIVNAL